MHHLLNKSSSYKKLKIHNIILLLLYSNLLFILLPIHYFLQLPLNRIIKFHSFLKFVYRNLLVAVLFISAYLILLIIIILFIFHLFIIILLLRSIALSLISLLFLVIIILGSLKLYVNVLNFISKYESKLLSFNPRWFWPVFYL